MQKRKINDLSKDILKVVVQPGRKPKSVPNTYPHRTQSVREGKDRRSWRPKETHIRVCRVSQTGWLSSPNSPVAGSETQRTATMGGEAAKTGRGRPGQSALPTHRPAGWSKTVRTGTRGPLRPFPLRPFPRRPCPFSQPLR